MSDFKRSIKTYVTRRTLKLAMASTVALLPLALAGPQDASAKVTGECYNCHTMHNSQNGNGSLYTPGPNPSLLITDCVGCHSHGSETTTYTLGNTTVPIVFTRASLNEADYANTLAGGNFAYVNHDYGNGSTDAENDSHGHNVFAGEPDDVLDVAPGKRNGCTNTGSCHEGLSDTAPTYAPHAGLSARQGCTKCHMVSDYNSPKGFHHTDDTQDPIVGASLDDTDGYYRFLTGHHTSEGQGVCGIEDDDWQATKSATDHNEYLGKQAYLDNPATIGDGSPLGNVMTGYCCGCHSDFHEQNEEADGSGAWLRHPSDAVIPSTGEYQYYTVYDPLVPVARPNLTGWTGPSNTVTPGTDMVMCLSCHRPHATPYPDILRWDYEKMVAGVGSGGALYGEGCFKCHTQKDE